jgi:DNA-binding FadR family transcriptional regulator
MNAFDQPMGTGERVRMSIEHGTVVFQVRSSDMDMPRQQALDLRTAPELITFLKANEPAIIDAAWKQAKDAERDALAAVEIHRQNLNAVRDRLTRLEGEKQ